MKGGKNAFTTGDAITSEQVKDASGTTLDVRTSNFSDFAKDILPVGKGTLVGMLGRYNGTWQLTLRTKADVKNFDGKPIEPENLRPDHSLKKHLVQEHIRRETDRKSMNSRTLI